ncbi:unnamed protein product, partial [Gulo gulo]
MRAEQTSGQQRAHSSLSNPISRLGGDNEFRLSRSKWESGLKGLLTSLPAIFRTMHPAEQRGLQSTCWRQLIIGMWPYQNGHWAPGRSAAATSPCPALRTPPPERGRLGSLRRLPPSAPRPSARTNSPTHQAPGSRGG